MEVVLLDLRANTGVVGTLTLASVIPAEEEYDHPQVEIADSPDARDFLTVLLGAADEDAYAFTRWVHGSAPRGSTSRPTH